jgi:hypothetical protein
MKATTTVLAVSVIPWVTESAVVAALSPTALALNVIAIA